MHRHHACLTCLAAATLVASAATAQTQPATAPQPAAVFATTPESPPLPTARPNPGTSVDKAAPKYVRTRLA